MSRKLAPENETQIRQRTQENGFVTPEQVRALLSEIDYLRKIKPYMEWSGHYCDGMTEAFSEAQALTEEVLRIKKHCHCYECAADLGEKIEEPPTKPCLSGGPLCASEWCRCKQ